MATPSGAPSTAASAKTPSKTHSPSDTGCPRLSDFGPPARAEQPSCAEERADDDGNEKQPEAGINQVERQIEHRRVLAPKKPDIAKRSGQRPQKDAAHQRMARQRRRAPAAGG